MKSVLRVYLVLTVIILEGVKMKYRSLIIFLVVALTSTFAQDIMVNQVGYLAGKEKIAYFTQAADSFYIEDNSNQAILFKGKIEVSKLNDPASGANVYFGNFTSLSTPGDYIVKTNTGNSSYPFVISSDPFTEVYNKSLKGFYFQRCGTALLTANAGVYARAACHLK